MNHYERDLAGNFIVVNDNGGFISLNEAADYLQIKPNTLNVWVIKNKYPSLKSYKIGRYRRFRTKDLHEFIQSRSTNTST